MAQNAMNTGASYAELVKNDPQVAMLALQMQWEKFTTALTLNVIPILVPVLSALTSALNTMGDFARAHPDLSRWLVVFTAGLAGLAVVLGAIAIAIGTFLMLAAPFGATVAAIAVGIGVAIAALGATITILPDLWRKFTAWLDSIVTAVENFGQRLYEAFVHMLDGVLSIINPSQDVVKKRLEEGQAHPFSGPQADATSPSWNPATIWDNLFGARDQIPKPAPLSGAKDETAATSDQSLVDRIASAIEQATHKVVNGAQVLMDGQTVGRIVTDHQSKDSKSAPTGPSDFDPSLTPFYPTSVW
jgi:hypothetical protein